jgi:alternate signal-mediated exported protein
MPSKGHAMNKLVKGALAGAAGIALLLGGAGTFAYWNSTAGVTGGTITAGDLKIVNDGAAGVWKDQTGTVINPATYRIVPGDVLTYTDDLTVTAVGKNIAATLGLAGGAITPVTTTNPTTNPDVRLASYLTANAVLTASGSSITPGTGTNVFNVTEGTGTVFTTVTLTFPLGTDTTNNDAKLGAVSLSNMALTLTQNHP